MDVFKAILARHSTRHFDPTPIPQETVMNILEVATHSPSSGNSQPWEIFVATGDTLERLRRIYYERLVNGNREPAGELKITPQMLERTEQRMIEIHKVCGTEPDSPEAMKEIGERVGHLCYAPCAVILCMPDALPLTYSFDMGLLAQSIMLAAQNAGLGSLVAMNIVAYPDVLREELGIPEDLSVVMGILLGYPDKEAPVNTFFSSRRPISEVVKYKD